MTFLRFRIFYGIRRLIADANLFANVIIVAPVIIISLSFKFLFGLFMCLFICLQALLRISFALKSHTFFHYKRGLASVCRTYKLA